MPQEEYIDVEFHLSDVSGRLRCPDQQEYSGRAQIDAALCQRLLELEHTNEFQAYGQALFEAAFPVGTDLHRGLYSVFDAARKEERRLRLRLHLDPAAPAELHGLHWELLSDGKDFEVGRSPDTVFSRYIAQPYNIGSSLARKRMLCVISAPIDAHRYNLAPIDYEFTRRRLDQALAGLRGSLKIDFLERPITPDRLRKQLKVGRYELLHIHGHGTRTHGGESALVLEDEEHKVNFTNESALRGILLGLRDLKLVTLVACHGGEPLQKDDHLSGLAGSLVQRGVPAVIAMRRAIKMSVGYQFTKSLYQQLAESPYVDAAINEARHELYMANPNSIDWSSPVLYMRLKDGLLWSIDDKGARFRPMRSRAFLMLLFVLLVTFSGLAILKYAELPGQVPVMTDRPSEGEDRSAPGDDLDEPSPVPPPPPPEPALEPIEKGRVGVAAIDSQSSSWNGDIARILSRQLQQQRQDLRPVLIPENLRPRLGGLLEGEMSLLPGGDETVDGLEYILLVGQSHRPLAATGPFSPVSVSCEIVVVSTREPAVKFHQGVSHTGNGNTLQSSLDQAFGRCVSDSAKEFP